MINLPHGVQVWVPTATRLTPSIARDFAAVAGRCEVVKSQVYGPAGEPKNFAIVSANIEGLEDPNLVPPDLHRLWALVQYWAWKITTKGYESVMIQHSTYGHILLFAEELESGTSGAAEYERNRLEVLGDD